MMCSERICKRFEKTFMCANQNIRKMDTVQIYRVLSFMLLFVFKSTQAFDGGDAIALILGLVLGIVGIFACIGCYARKRSG
ncbi:unnamed protein product [Brachionus calyciflorus]|uniref:Uncharacterized protein n=1 Tax=Brachionus calyciflorus TaxID=104777 RepID=A0A813M9W8_9BILA|nr:unnamed protein product [Brachionus calyciflorus]